MNRFNSWTFESGASKVAEKVYDLDGRATCQRSWDYNSGAGGKNPLTVFGEIFSRVE